MTYLVALIAVFPLFNTVQAESCKCQNKAVLELAYQRAANVFIGRIVEQKANPLKPGFLQVQVEVLKRFKDDKEIRGENLVFYTPETAENCGVAFQPGFEYLIFAYGNPAFYRTTSCDPTDVLENAQVTLARVGKLAGVSVGALDNLPELKPQPTVATLKPSPKKRNLGQLD